MFQKKNFQKNLPRYHKIGKKRGISPKSTIGVSINVFFYTPETGWLEYCEIDKYILNYIKLGLKNLNANWYLYIIKLIIY